MIALRRSVWALLAERRPIRRGWPDYEARKRLDRRWSGAAGT